MSYYDIIRRTTTLHLRQKAQKKRKKSPGNGGNRTA